MRNSKYEFDSHQGWKHSVIFSRSQATVLSTISRSEMTAVSRGKDEQTEMTGGFLVVGPFHVYILSLRHVNIISSYMQT